MHNEIVYLQYIHMRNHMQLLLVQNRKQNRLFCQQNVSKNCRDEQKGKQLHTHISLYHVLFLQVIVYVHKGQLCWLENMNHWKLRISLMLCHKKSTLLLHLPCLRPWPWALKTVRGDYLSAQKTSLYFSTQLCWVEKHKAFKIKNQCNLTMRTQQFFLHLPCLRPWALETVPGECLSAQRTIYSSFSLLYSCAGLKNIKPWKLRINVILQWQPNPSLAFHLSDTLGLAPGDSTRRNEWHHRYFYMQLKHLQ